MILDQIDQCERYASVYPNFAKAFAFLTQPNLATLAPGKYEIDGEQVFAIVDKARARARERAPLEAHRRYIDIQFVISGVDEMGWRSKPLCKQTNAVYDPEKDIEFFDDKPETWIAVGRKTFAVFFPEDAHAPLTGSGEVHKVVVKVKV
ncbi:YhcH/YjgK/YiaL family protein [candidate division KSB1 bacterium]|nr:YhcH/YjgK/YiaL family protein [candidate division KSB1 bacterium]